MEMKVLQLKKNILNFLFRLCILLMFNCVARLYKIIYWYDDIKKSFIDIFTLFEVTKTIPIGP